MVIFGSTLETEITGLLIDQMLGVRQTEESRMAPRFLPQAARRMEWALTEIMKATGEAGLWGPSELRQRHIKLGMPIRHVKWAAGYTCLEIRNRWWVTRDRFGSHQHADVFKATRLDEITLRDNGTEKKREPRTDSWALQNLEIREMKRNQQEKSR